MELIHHSCTKLKSSLPSLACLVRQALLAGEDASEEQQKILKDYKKEFQWVNNLLFDEKLFSECNKSKKPSLFLIK